MIIVTSRNVSHIIDPYNIMSIHKFHFQLQLRCHILINSAPKNVYKVNISYIASGDLILCLSATSTGSCASKVGFIYNLNYLTLQTSLDVNIIS